MKSISLNVSERAYDDFQSYSRQRGRPVAELIREAMDLYLDEKIRPARRLLRMPTTSLPKLRRRWTRDQIQEELLG